jgi:hypothetical protein
MRFSPPFRRRTGAIILAVAVAGLLTVSADAQPSPETRDQTPSNTTASDAATAASPALTDAKTGAGNRLLVQFKPQASDAARGAALASVSARELRTIPDIGVHVVTVPAAAATAVAHLTASPAVAFAEPDGLLQPQESLPNDPYFPQQYALGGGAWGWYQTHTTQAWDVTKGAPSVVVAILDTGLKTAGLSDFDGQVVSGWNVLSNSSDTSSQAGNHGTYVAGVVGLAGSNGVGNSGFFKNSVGSVQVSVLTAPVGGGAPPPPPPASTPASTAPPAISGTAQDGQTVTASTGSWSGSPTSYAYLWQRCDSSGANCVALSGATSSSYTAQTADVGSTLRVAVTASNAAGSTTAVSAATAAVASAPAPPPPPSASIAQNRRTPGKRRAPLPGPLLSLTSATLEA